MEINARSMQPSTVVSRPVVPEGEQKAEYEGFGEGSLRTVLSARSIAPPRREKTATRSPFLIFVDQQQVILPQVLLAYLLSR